MIAYYLTLFLEGFIAGTLIRLAIKDTFSKR